MIKKITYIPLVIAVLMFTGVLVEAQSVDIPEVLKSADKFHQEKSYHLALINYEILIKSEKLNEVQVREVSFKLADSALKTKDKRRFKDAKKALLELINDDNHDLWWAEANESLIDHYLYINKWENRQNLESYFTNARQYWAGSTNVDRARDRFIDLSFKYGEWISSVWGGYYQNVKPVGLVKNSIIPEDVQTSKIHIIYEEILTVARLDGDKAKANYFLAVSLLNGGHDEGNRKRSEKYFKEIIKKYDSTEWYDDALFSLAQFYNQNKQFNEALKYYNILTKKFQKGKSKYFDRAKKEIKSITAPFLDVGVNYTFVPGSEIAFQMSWRNISQAEIALYKIDLTSLVKLNMIYKDDSSSRGLRNYRDVLKRIVEVGHFRSLPAAIAFQTKLENNQEHKFFNSYKSLSQFKGDKNPKGKNTKETLAPGAYLLLVTSGGELSFDLVLVTDMGMISKVGGESAVFHSFDAKTGKPKVNAQVQYVYRYHNENGNWVWDEGSGVTDKNGLLHVKIKSSLSNNYGNRHDLFVCSSDKISHACTANNYHDYNPTSEKWRLYATTDRPAYRPNEEIFFKGIMRTYGKKLFSTPLNLKVKVHVYNPRGEKIFDKIVQLNEFGSFSEGFILDEKATLGEYRLTVYDENEKHQLATQALFRLEEYKLPEFKVTLMPKKKEDGTKTYQLADKIQVEVDAQYYFGGAVQEAQVEVLVYQKNYYHRYYPVRKHAWFYSDVSKNHYYGKGTLVKKHQVKTNKYGKAVIEIETPEKSEHDIQYNIEARVVDQSRREVRSTANIKVGKQSYYAYLNPKSSLYRPADNAEVNIKTMTINNDPVSVEGVVKVYKYVWRQKEYDSQGKLIIYEPYQNNEILQEFIKTNDKGEHVFSFEPNEDGAYVIEFKSLDKNGQEIIAQTYVYVCQKDSQDIGYRYQGIRIIAERDTYQIGDTARVMILTDRPDSWVLFSQEADEIYDVKLIYMQGPVKLLEFKIGQELTPNIFLNALQVHHYQMNTFSSELIIPPNEKFLNVSIASDKSEYKPGEKGEFKIKVTDNLENPVVGELALGIVDASIYYIQKELAQNIQEYFYGKKRIHSIRSNTSFNSKRYAKLVYAKDMNLVPERDLDAYNLNSQKGGKKYDSNRYEPYYLQADYDSNGFLSRSSAPAKLSMAKGESFHDELTEVSKVADMKQTRSRQKSQSKKDGGDSQVRSDFRSTIIWQPSVITDKNGEARLTITFPDSLTSWRTTARAITKATQVGSITHEVKTNKDIIIRLQAPRFFTQRDEVTISANVHNFSDKTQEINVSIEVEGLSLKSQREEEITLEPGAEQRVDWQAIAQAEGLAKIIVKAKGLSEQDGVIKSYPVIPHGIEKFIAKSMDFKLQGNESKSKEFTFIVPKKRIIESTTLDLNLSPSLAATMLDALPYLADYPYGCVEQTMSRFIPSIIVKKILKDLGLSDDDVEQYIENVLIPREDPSHPDRKLEKTLSRINDITKVSLDRIYNFQQPDGGWGWWNGGESDHFMSAYVVWGLSLAKKSGVRIKAGVLKRGIDYLVKEIVEEEDHPDNLAWMLHALAHAGSNSEFELKQSLRLWEKRDQLNAYTRALFALSEHLRGRKGKAVILTQNMFNGIIEDKENNTLHWGESGVHYRWSEGGVEATAFSLKALVAIDPNNEMIEKAVKWIALNRRGSRWKNTRDTAISILALADYVKLTNELNPNYEFKITLNDKIIHHGRVSSKNLFKFNRKLRVPQEELKNGKNKINIQINGRGSLYVSGYLRYFTLEEGITPEGNEIYVHRKYFKQSQEETLLKGVKDSWIELENHDVLKSAERVRVEMILEAKNHYEYLILEDFKPAGFEAVELKSGNSYAEIIDEDGKSSGSAWVYQEFRDKKAVFFLDKVKEGKTRIRYELRAEVPGTFHGMPNQAHAMYVPEIRSNSAESQFTISD